MFSLSLLLTTLLTTTLALPTPTKSPSCGDVSILFTGLPPSHPLVLAQGFSPSAVNAAIRSDAAHILSAGYNLRVVLMGAEIPLSVLSSQLSLQDTHWDGVGIGYGVRGSRKEDVTIRLEDIIQLYREQAPGAPIMFDYSPDSAFWAIQRHFPLGEDCADSPGTDLGFEVFCDICTDSTNSTSA